MRASCNRGARMKTIFLGQVDITVECVEDEFIATCSAGETKVESESATREYAAIADLFYKLKKVAIDKARKEVQK
jgi:hypothetical protein